MTHDSFVLPEGTLTSFTHETGIAVKTVKSGDAGQLASSVALTPGRPKADAVYGIDNTFASRVIDAGALEPYTSSAQTPEISRYALAGAGADQLTPIDRGDVCVNVDTAWFAQRKIEPPTSIAQLTEARYRNTVVALDPATSSPGLGFLMATIGKYRGDWQHYWKSLRDNGATISSSWNDAYNTQFSGGEGKGRKPIVVSYASSPASNPATTALLDGCFRQVEYAGVLKGAANVDAAHKLIDFLLSARVQQTLPDAMYVYPLRPGVALPASWQRYARPPTNPITVAPADIAANRQSWQQQWRRIFGR